MHRYLQFDVLRLAFLALFLFIAAALLTPWAMNLGYVLSDITREHSLTPTLDHLGAKARFAQTNDFFLWTLSALTILAIPFLPALLKVKNLQNSAFGRRPWGIALPRHSVAETRGQRLRKGTQPVKELIGGLSLATGMVAVTAFAVIQLGLFEISELTSENGPTNLIFRIFTLAIGVSIFEEIIFRGILLGILLRTFRPSLAMGLSALLFAALHFLQPTPASSAGFANGIEVLQGILLQYGNADFIFFQFTTLFLVGLVLAIARYLTASLWLPMGLHIGWIFSFELFQQWTTPQVKELASLRPILGQGIHEGLLPIALLLLTAALLPFLYRSKKTLNAP